MLEAPSRYGHCLSQGYPEIIRLDWPVHEVIAPQRSARVSVPSGRDGEVVESRTINMFCWSLQQMWFSNRAKRL